jgi:hypothetical protein
MKIYLLVTLWCFEKALIEIPPVLPFSKGGELGGDWRGNSFLLFPLWEREAVKKLQ